MTVLLRGIYGCTPEEAIIKLSRRKTNKNILIKPSRL